MIITINSNNAHTVQSLLYKVHMNEPRTEDEFYGWVCLVESSYYNAITPLTGQITTSWASDWLTWAWPWVSVWAMRGQGWGRPITVLRERERGESSVCRRHDTQHERRFVMKQCSFRGLSNVRRYVLDCLLLVYSIV